MVKLAKLCALCGETCGEMASWVYEPETTGIVESIGAACEPELAESKLWIPLAQLSK